MNVRRRWVLRNDTAQKYTSSVRHVCAPVVTREEMDMPSELREHRVHVLESYWF